MNLGNITLPRVFLVLVMSGVISGLITAYLQALMKRSGNWPGEVRG